MPVSFEKSRMSSSNPFDRRELLTPRNEWYANILSDFWENQLKWDGFDITTTTLLGKNEPRAKGKLFAKTKGILAGQEEIEFLLTEEEDGLEVAFLKKDGEQVLAGEKIMEVWGTARNILRIERILVNMLSRLSGIATLTHNLVAMLPKHIIFCATRKTLWGPIDKRGIVIGGGSTHRLGLFDAILVKENHLALFPEGFKAIAAKISAEKDIGAFWDIEVKSEAEFHDLLDHLPTQRPGIIMFDNFSPSALKKIVKSVKKPDGILYEAGGGINPRNIVEYANSGVDAINSGFITNAVSPLDFSMQIVAS